MRRELTWQSYFYNLGLQVASCTLGLCSSYSQMPLIPTGKASGTSLVTSNQKVDMGAPIKAATHTAPVAFTGLNHRCGCPRRSRRFTSYSGLCFPHEGSLLCPSFQPAPGAPDARNSWAPPGGYEQELKTFWKTRRPHPSSKALSRSGG